MTLKDIGLALLSGILLTLPFLNFSLAPLAWIALVPLILVAAGRRVWEGALFGFLAGVVYGYGGVYWLSRVTVAGYGVLGCYLALYPAVWGGWISWIISRRPGWFWWTAPAGWVALEYLRTYLFSGFPWNLLGVSQVRFLPLIQIAAITGIYGVSFLVVLVNAALISLLIFFRSGGRKKKGINVSLLPLLAAGVAILGVLGYGYRVLWTAPATSPGNGALSVTLVQGGILQELKWEHSLAAAHFKTYLRLSRKAMKSNPDLVIWPESALPYYLEEHPAIQRLLSRLAAEGKTYLLLGGDYKTGTTPPRYYNSAYLFNPAGREWERYDKVHLVPFGEYTPLKRFLPFLRRVVPWEEDFSAGEIFSLFTLKGLPEGKDGDLQLGVLICFEDIFPAPARSMVRRGAGLLVNITNDAWYGRTIAPFQHAYGALFRAVENRIYLARATNTGYSCVIDPRGRVVGELVDETGESLFISDWSTATIFPGPSGSFYTRWGDLFSWGCVGLTLVAFFGCSIRKGEKI